MDWRFYADPFLAFKGMIRILGRKLGLVALLLAGIFACSKKDSAKKDDQKGSSSNREAVLINAADEIIIPSYANFKLKLDVMTNKTDAFTSNPTPTTLQDLRTAWVNAYTDWQKVEMFEFGPAEQYVLRGYFNIYPANVSIINTNITSETANLDLPANFSSEGFPAIDYLINGLSNTDAITLTFYTTAPDAAKRIAYLKSVTAKMQSVFNNVNTEWKGSYRSTFISKTGVDASSSISSLVNGYVHNYERTIRSGKFGIPSGSMLNGTVSPQSVEAYYKKDISLILAKTAQQATIDFFNGKSVKTGNDGPSLKTYLSSLPTGGSTLATDILNQFNTTTTKLNAIATNDLSSVVQNNNQLMVDVYTEMQKSVRLLKVDMTSAMSITITYTDNDGD